MEDYRIIPGALLIVLGVSILLKIDIWAFVWPALLIFLGIKIMTGQGRQGRNYEMGQTEEVESERINVDTIFGAMNKKVTSNNFRGGKVTMVFGGGEIDLRDAKITDGTQVQLEVDAVFGGCKIIVPDTWSVTSHVVGILGGTSNQTALPSKDKENGRLLLIGSAVFGGVEVANQ